MKAGRNAEMTETPLGIILATGWAIARFNHKNGKDEIVLEPIIAWELQRHDDGYIEVRPITVGGLQQLNRYSLLRTPDSSYVKDNGWTHCADDKSARRNCAGCGQRMPPNDRTDQQKLKIY
jgi:hypothetical protein